MECGLGGETRIVEKFKLIPTCRGIDLLGLKVNREVEIWNDFYFKSAPPSSGVCQIDGQQKDLKVCGMMDIFTYD